MVGLPRIELGSIRYERNACTNKLQTLVYTTNKEKIMKNKIINEAKRIAKELNRPPTRDEFISTLNGIKPYEYKRYFENYRDLLVQADLKSVMDSSKSQVSCKHCDKTFEKSNQDIEKTSNNFCSRSCAATYNNLNRTGYTFNITKRRFFPRLTPNYIYLKSFVLCENCNTIYNKIGTRLSNNNTCSSFCNMELGMKNRIMKDSIKRTGANTYDAIRQNARVYSKYFYPPLCMVCGYDKHYEVCHIKDLKDFTRDETFYEINHKTNLIHLCCNCHWEFDKGLIDINTIKEVQLTY